MGTFIIVLVQAKKRHKHKTLGALVPFMIVLRFKYQGKILIVLFWITWILCEISKLCSQVTAPFTCKSICRDKYDE